MASGKLSPRQKMINLMYLVLIAMLALNMSKEVLSAFGLMNEKFGDANGRAIEMNEKALAAIQLKAEEKPEEFGTVYNKAQQIASVSKGFYTYLGGLYGEVLKGSKVEVDKDGNLPYETMDKGDYIDENWFAGDKLSPKGQEFMDAITKYKEDVKKIIGNDVKYTKALENFDKKFDIEKIKANDGATKNYLDYHYKGFPVIASLTKLSAMQNDVKTTEENMYNLFLGNSLDEAVSLKNYQAIVLADKSAFFAGEKFSGKVVLGKYANTVPTAVEIGGQKLNMEEAIDSTGAARLDFNVGNVGEKEIDGKFTFLEDGKPIEIPIKGNYVVVPRPNSATIAADKMNVVYRGVENPMTISFAGIPDNKVNASAPGLRKAGKAGKYIMNPTGIKGREVTISVTGKLEDGSPTSDKATFRIKEIPAPTGTVRGSSGMVKMSKSGLEKSTVRAELQDFDFELPLSVSQFSVKVPGQATITCSGSKLSSKAKSALKKAKRGSQVTVFDIKAKIKGNSKYRLKRVSPVIIEITN